MRFTAASFAAAFLALTMAGCGPRQSDPPPPTDPAPNSTPTPPPVDPTPTPPVADPSAPAAGAVVTDPSFELRAATSAPYHSGALSQFSITLTPTAGWHVNQEYPTRIELTGPAQVTLPKTTLERADAAQFTETTARFEVPFTPTAAGAHEVRAHVSFAVCTDENCVPAEHTLAIALPVEAQ